MSIVSDLCGTFIFSLNFINKNPHSFLLNNMGGLHRKAKTARNALKAQQKRGKNDDNLFSSRSGSKKKSNKNSSQNKPTSSASRNGPVRKDELDEEDFQDRQTNWTLAALQDKIKRDPLAYELEFQAQHRHFEAVLETLLLSPQKPAKDFDEQLMFLAHCWPMFEKKGEKKGEFAFSLRKLLLEHHVELHPATRKALVQALILLRNRNQYELIEAMGLWFELLAAEDRALRSMVYTHIVRDILRMNEKSKDQTENRSLQAYFFEQLVCGSGGAALAKGGGGKKHDGSVKGADATTGGGGKTPKTAFNANHATARKALVILISLYKKNVWTTPAVVNQIALCCEHPDAATAKAAIHFLLGNHHLVGENEVRFWERRVWARRRHSICSVSKRWFVIASLSLEAVCYVGPLCRKIGLSKGLSKRDHVPVPIPLVYDTAKYKKTTGWVVHVLTVPTGRRGSS